MFYDLPSIKHENQERRPGTSIGYKIGEDKKFVGERKKLIHSTVFVFVSLLIL